MKQTIAIFAMLGLAACGGGGGGSGSGVITDNMQMTGGTSGGTSGGGSNMNNNDQNMNNNDQTTAPTTGVYHIPDINAAANADPDRTVTDILTNAPSGSTITWLQDSATTSQKLIKTTEGKWIQFNYMGNTGANPYYTGGSSNPPRPTSSVIEHGTPSNLYIGDQVNGNTQVLAPRHTVGHQITIPSDATGALEAFRGQTFTYAQFATGGQWQDGSDNLPTYLVPDDIEVNNQIVLSGVNVPNFFITNEGTGTPVTDLDHTPVYAAVERSTPIAQPTPAQLTAAPLGATVTYTYAASGRTITSTKTSLTQWTSSDGNTIDHTAYSNLINTPAVTQSNFGGLVASEVREAHEQGWTGRGVNIIHHNSATSTEDNILTNVAPNAITWEGSTSGITLPNGVEYRVSRNRTATNYTDISETVDLGNGETANGAAYAGTTALVLHKFSTLSPNQANAVVYGTANENGISVRRALSPVGNLR